MTHYSLKRYLESKALQLRRDSIIMTTKAGSGHPTSCLSAADLVAGIFFYAMRIDVKDFNNQTNDRFILSKGHAAPLLYSAYAQLGLIPESELYTYREFNSNLEGHPTSRFPYAQVATGSLGMGLSLGAGMAYSAKRDNLDFRTFVLLGDSELTEGSIWEAAEIASYYKLDNLIGVADINKLGQTGETIHGYHLERYSAKFEAFGWRTIIIDGHDINQIIQALEKAVSPHKNPTMILAKTVKGYGVESVENKNGYHGKPFTKEAANQVIAELESRFSSTNGADLEEQYVIQNSRPKKPCIPKSCDSTSMKSTNYKLGSLVATRKAYGTALVDAGMACEQVISLDAEVNNSTFADLFEHVYPERFIQCFIAEQNMVSMAVGLQALGHIPFVSTFAAFFTRAYDQLRMAAIGRNCLRCCGSHAGVSIGADGPSQMGLEDIGLFCSLPGSIVLYPSDAISTHKLVQLMLGYNQGISYLRTTRPETPVIYANNQKFNVGGCTTLRSSDNDQACVVAAGITVHEALKAYDSLSSEGIFISVIDLYCIKPLDTETILATAKSSGNRIITVEDHYLDCGIGQQVCFALRNSSIKITCLGVTELPRSGKPEELLAWANIDAKSIVKVVKKAINKAF